MLRTLLRDLAPLRETLFRKQLTHCNLEETIAVVSLAFVSF